MQDFVTYRLTGYSDGPDYFNISSTTGSIFIKTDLRSDRNKKTSYLVGSYHQAKTRKYTWTFY